MEFQGTKGEWKAQKNIAYWEVNNNCNYQEGSISMSICTSLSRINKKIENLNFTEEAKANAQLIASAPELLEALKSLSFRMSEQLTLGNIKHNKKEAERDLDISIKAIKKALGEQC